MTSRRSPISTTGLVRITANGTGISSATAMELTGPYCSPCVLSVKVSQTATALVMDAQLNNPGTFTVKLRDGSQLTAGKDFTVSTPAIASTFFESFATPPNYQNNWTYTATAGVPVVSYASGKFSLVSANSANPGTNALLVSKQIFAGVIDVAFKSRHAGFGATSVGLMSGGNWLARLTIDTNDTAYMFYCPNVSTCDGYLKYPSASFLNRDLVVRIKTISSQVWFYIDGTLRQTYSYAPPTAPFQLAFSVGSISWKSGNNNSDFYEITAKAGTTTTPAPTTGTVGVTVSGYSGTISCNLNSTGITAPTTLSAQPAGSYSLACTAPSGYTITGIAPSSTQTLSAGATVNFAVGLKSTVPSLSNVSCSVSSTSVQTGTQVTYTANWSGGSGSPGFNWSGHVSGTTRSVSKTFDSAGTYTASVTVMDNGQQLTGQCSNVTVTAPAPPPPSLSVSWFWFSPDSPKTTDTITLNFTGTGFNSSTQVWVFGLNCASGCQAGVVASSVTSTSMKALAQLRNVDNFQIKLRNGSSGNFVSAGTLPVR